MDDIFMIHLDDYIQHIDDKLTLYAMLHQMEVEIKKLPDCEATAQVRRQMEAYSPKIKELWDGWNIPPRYLVTADLDDLSDLMDDELFEPEDAGYYNVGDACEYVEEAPAPTPALADHELLLALMDTADKLYENYSDLISLARRQLCRCEQ